MSSVKTLQTYNYLIKATRTAKCQILTKTAGSTKELTSDAKKLIVVMALMGEIPCFISAT